MMYKTNRFFILVLMCLMMMPACSNYSFTGAALSPEIKSISIKNFPNRADVASPQLSSTFTRALEDQFLSGTNLDLVEDNGDIMFEGVILRYDVQSRDVRDDGRAATNSLNITVNVRFTNKFDEEQNFEERFTSFADFDASASFHAVEDELMRQICEELAEKIFNRAVIDW